MYAKILLLVVVLAAVSALPQKSHEYDHHHREPAYSSQKITQHHGHAKKILVDGHAKYEFAYEVKDPHTHDIKHQHETRHGDTVKGEYSLHQPDGTIRIVKYSSDKKGFSADVKQEGHAKHIVPENHYHH